jgi:hypothetical protein
MITLKNLKEVGSQEVFDQVCNHLLSQNEACMEYHHNVYTCTYKNSKGQKCAAGCFIADEEYHGMFEGKCWTSLVDMGLVPEAHQTAIRSFQRIHDESSPSSWRERLEEYAKMKSLNFNYGC